ncbi:Protein of unknown function [Aquiflexum balticum DSM 16537]|uniref:DUF4007 domain-containing protein n=1 Tax=Aquiflexum balticum DSM 16537 TaxID=758820 RepID=A0A1W2H1C8_9BACT|nr:DUF4007 family protein [Aquiflexum balticum]SMD42428.1 Protein of unknown function [Aquiflexum balticum DSM 16537]
MSSQKLSFTGHETFHCRSFWLKKGVDFLEDKGDFSADDSVLKLGVGKNMVASIHFWLKAFGVKDEDGNVSELANRIFAPGGWDEFLEYPGSLWIWQYHLVNLGKASIYRLFFKEFRKLQRRNQFQISQLEQFLRRNTDGKVAEKTLQNDVKVFVKMYLVEERAGKGIEDDLSSMFVELNLISQVPVSTNEKTYQLRVDHQKEIPSLVFLYCILDSFPNRESISMEEIIDQAGDALVCTNEGVERHVGNLCELFPGQITFKEDAGRKEVQIDTSLDKWEILKSYYNA